MHVLPYWLQISDEFSFSANTASHRASFQSKSCMIMPKVYHAVLGRRTPPVPNLPQRITVFPYLKQVKVTQLECIAVKRVAKSPIWL